MVRLAWAGLLVVAFLSLFAPGLSAAAPVIADLAPNGTTSSSVTLTWTVSGGGAATVYDLRMSTAPITGANFADATVIGGLAAPTGGTESHTASGLFPDTRYWFAVKAFAATGDSAISNVATAMTTVADTAFTVSTPVTGASSLYASANGDFNGDGHLDLAFSVDSGGSGNIIFYPGDGAGGFGAPTTSSAILGNYPLRPTAADFTGDGHLDLAVPNFSSNTVSLLAGNGNGGFTNVGAISPGTEPNAIVFDDFDRDGDLDLAVTLWGGHAVAVYLNDGAGGFTLKGSYGGYGGNDRLGSPQAADFDGDGILDFLVANYGTTEIGWGNTVGFMKGNGDGSFADAVSYVVGRQPGNICVGDLDRDGKLDFTATCDLEQWVAVCLGNGDGTFAAAVNYPLGSNVHASRLADLDGDGDLDLFLTRYSAGDLAYLVGNGDGTFQAPVSLAPGETIRDLTIGDFDRDGKPDVMALGTSMANVYFLRNATPWGPAGSFLPPANYSSGYHPNYVTVGDLDGDGVLDVVTTSQFTRNFFSLYMGNADGTLGAETQIGGVLEPHMPLFADFNRDGRLDLAIAELEGARVSIRLGNGDGTFQAPLNAGVASGPVSLVADDFDGDGILDLGVGHWFSNWFAILIGNGDGTFAPAVLHDIGAKSFNPVTADFTGDGIVDIVTGNYGLNSLSLFTGVGDGTFTHSYISLPGNGTPYLGDFNGDGKPDLAVSSNASGGSILILLGNGDGSFQAPLTYAIGSGNLAVGDLDRDGKLDLALADRNHASATVLFGLGDGTFAAPARFATAAGTGDIELEDFNRDGRLDVITSNVDSDSISILLNTAPSAPPPGDGLVAWWRGEDNGVDSVGGHHGILQGGIGFAAGHEGDCFDFDGSDDAVRVGALSTNITSFTLSAWINPDLDENRPILEWNDESGGATAYGPHLWYFAGGAIFANIAENPPTSFSSASGVLSLNSWHHVAVTYDATSGVATLYAHGQQVAQTNVGAFNPHTEYPFFIGRRPSSPSGPGEILSFDGRIDSPEVFNRALSPTEIAALAGAVPNGFRFAGRAGMPRNSQVVSDPVFAEGITASVPISVVNGEYRINGGGWTAADGTVAPGDEVAVRLTTSANFATAVAATLTIGGVEGAFTATTAAEDDPPADGLVAWWRAEDNALDSVGGNHGTLSGGTAYTNSQSGRAFEFDGIDGMVVVPHDPALNSTGSLTIALWLKFDALPGTWRDIIQKGIGTSNTQYYIRTNDASGLDFGIVNGTDEYSIHSSAATSYATLGIAAGTWHHVAFAVDDASHVASIYVDGVLKTSFAGVANPLAQNTNDLTIGGFAWDGYFSGAIDEVKIFNRALSGEEVEELSGVVPDAFSFTDQAGVMPHLLTASEPITVTGIRYPTGIAIDVGEYEINGSGTWLSAPGTVAAGDTVRVHLMSSATYGATVEATLTIGGLSDTFSVTTIEQHAVVFRTDGTEGATVNGAATVTQLVLDGEDCAPVTVAAPDGYDFLGWTGGYVGLENPLTLTNITASLTVTANFAMQQVAVGSVIVLDAADVVGIDLFRQQPKAYALHDLNGKVGSKASVKVLDKVDKVNGTATVRCEWTKRLRLYDVKAFKAAEAGGIGAAEWITPATMRDLPMELHVVSKEAVPPDQDIQPLALAVPVIANIAPGEPDPKGNPTWTITGQWFGTKKPKVWREYTVPGKAEGAVVIKRQGLKVVKPTELNTEYRDSKGKPACMDPLTGESKVIVLAPSKDPKGPPNGTIVLDNGVGLAAGDAPGGG